MVELAPVSVAVACIAAKLEPKTNTKPTPKSLTARLDLRASNRDLGFDLARALAFLEDLLGMAKPANSDLAAALRFIRYPCVLLACRGQGPLFLISLNNNLTLIWGTWKQVANPTF
jgi:hypothetical protein